MYESNEGGLGRPQACDSSKILWKWLVDENKWQRVKKPYHKNICNNISGYCKNVIRSYCKCTEGIFLCSECYTTHVIDGDT